MINIHSAYSKHDASSASSHGAQPASSNNMANASAVLPAAVTSNSPFPAVSTEAKAQSSTRPGAASGAPAIPSETNAIDAALKKTRRDMENSLAELDATPAPAPPQPQLTLANWLRQTLKDKYGQDIDPDHTYLTTFNYDTGGKPGQGPYPGKVVRKVSLTEAVRQNLQKGELGDALGMVPWRAGGPGIQDVGDKLPIRKPSGKLFDIEGNWSTLPHLSDEKSDLTYAYEGIYREGQPQRYDASSQLNISPDDLRALIRDNDPLATTRSKLISFWKDAGRNYPDQLRAAFMKSALQAIPAVAPTAPKPGDLKPEDMHIAATLLDPFRSSDVEAGRLSIFAFPSLLDCVSTDMTLGHDKNSDRYLLYIPGDRAPLHGFDSMEELVDWVAGEVKDPARRASFASHFSAADRKDGTSNVFSISGVDSILSGIAAYPEPYTRPDQFSSSGAWDAQEYFRMTPDLEGSDAFNNVFLGTKQRSYADANALVTSNQQAGIGSDNPRFGKFVVNGDPADFEKAIDFLKGDSEMARVIDEIKASGKTYTVEYVNDWGTRYEPFRSTLYWNPHLAIQTTNGGKMSPALALGHELVHARAGLGTIIPGLIPMRDYDNLEEWRVVTGVEKHAAHTFHQGERTDHLGSPYRVADPLST